MTTRQCVRCQKDLEDPASREVGVGPVCRKLDNKILATYIPADLRAADAAFARVDFSRVAEGEEVLRSAWARIAEAMFLPTTAMDWRQVVRQIEWTLSFGQSSETFDALVQVVEALGYVALAAVWMGDAAKGKARAYEEQGRLYIEGPRNAGANVAIKAIAGRRFHAQGSRPSGKASWSVPCAEFVAFRRVVCKHFPNHEADWPALEAASAAAAPATPAAPKAPETRIERAGEWLLVYTPYSAAFVDALKSALPHKARKWSSQFCCWQVLDTHLATVEALIAKHYKTAA